MAGARVMVLSQYVELSYAEDLLADGRGGMGYLLKDRVSDVEDFLRRSSGSPPEARSSTRSWSRS